VRLLVDQAMEKTILSKNRWQTTVPYVLVAGKNLAL